MGGRGSKSATGQGMGRQREGNASGGMTFEQFAEKYLDDDYNAKPWPEGLSQDLREQGLNGGSLYQVWLDENGEYDKPRIVSNAELDRLIDEGAQVILRGMPTNSRSTGEAKLEQVMYSDKYYTGNGVYGDGLYFAEHPATATAYALNNSTRGAIMRAVLSPDAKIADYGRIYDAMRKAYPKAYIDDGVISAYARSLGYDAMTIGRSGDDMYYNVLNRSKLIVADDLGRVRQTADGAVVSFSEQVRGMR